MRVFMKSLPPESCTTTNTGGLAERPGRSVVVACSCAAVRASIPFSPRSSGKLVLGGGDDQGQQLADAGRATFVPGVDVTPLSDEVQEGLPRLGADIQGAGELEALVDHLVGGQRV